jgi:mono/diheme cytochrome c family protein
VRALAASLLVAVVACGGGGERAGMTADSAVIQSRDTSEPAGDTALAFVDSVNTDSTQTDSGSVATPTLVLLADSASGDVLYRRKGKCLSCHGLDGKGLEGLGTNLQDAEWLHGDGSIDFIQRVINEGIARPKVAPIAMPSLATTLAPDEVYRIAAYVYTLSHPGVAVADTTRLPIDTMVVPIDTMIPPADTTGRARAVTDSLFALPPTSAGLPPL